jgi:hypothetical protein
MQTQRESAGKAIGSDCLGNCKDYITGWSKEKSMQSTTYDAIVVGSGISGGWAAKELTEKGLRVLLLERGRNVEHIKDYVNATKAPWQYLHRGGKTTAMEEAYQVLRRDLLNEKNLSFWANEQDSPYTEVKRFDWYRGYQVGGKSLMWGRQSYRWSDFDFEANAKDGIAVDWPIRYADLAPWYDHVEKARGDLRFDRALAATARRTVPAGDAAELRRGTHCRPPEDRVRRHATPDHRARRERDQGARRTLAMPVSQRLLARLPVRRLLQHAVLDAAGGGKDRQAHAEAVVDRDRDPARQEAQARDRRARDRCGHRTDDRLHGKDRLRLRVDAELGMVADALGDRHMAGRTRQQLRGTRPQPHGSSVPRRRRRLPEGLNDKYYYGRRPNGIYIPRYRNLFGDKRDYLRGFGYQGNASRDGMRGREGTGNRRGLRDETATPAHGNSVQRLRRDALSNHESRPGSTSARTSGACRSKMIDCATGENERLMRRTDQRHGGDARRRTGAKRVTTYDGGYFPGMGIHEMGKTRAWGGIRRPRCSTRTTRSGMRRTCSSPMAHA